MAGIKRAAKTVRQIVALAAVSFTAFTPLAAAPPVAASTPAPSGNDHWVASWTASPSDSATPFDAAGYPVPEVLVNQTLRMIITPHLGGSIVRIHLSNRFGKAPALFGRVTVGLEGHGAVSGLTAVTFGGSAQVRVPVGQDVISDPVELSFAAFTPLSVSIFLPGTQSFPTKHWNANATSLYAPAGSGDLVETSSNAPFLLRTESWLYTDEVDVEAPATTGAVVAFGDSITDGFVAATPVSLPVTLAIADKNGRYPDDLQRRIDAAGVRLSVLNAGISSNRLVTDGEPLLLGLSGVQRFEEDVLDVPGVRGVIVLEGINDLGIPPATTTPIQLITGYEELIAIAHARGVKIWLATLLPASNAIIDGVATAPRSEGYREQVNTWIRDQHLADGVIDFDAALRDPDRPGNLAPRYSGPDHLHPNLLGYDVMASTVDLSMLESVVP